MTSAYYNLMQFRLLVLALALAAAPLAKAGEAPSCAAAAQDVLAGTPGQLLSVIEASDRCTIIFLMHREGKRPRRMTFDLPVRPRLSGRPEGKMADPAKFYRAREADSHTAD